VPEDEPESFESEELWHLQRKSKVHTNAEPAHQSHRHKAYATRARVSISKDDIVIVLMGKTSAGKTTWVLALADYLRQGALHSLRLLYNVLDASGTPIFPPDWVVEDAQGCGNDDGTLPEGTGDQRHSQTMYPTLYYMGHLLDSRDTRRVFVLDTAGFLDTREGRAGMTYTGRDLLGHTLDAISDLPHLTALVIIQSSDHTAVRETWEAKALAVLFRGRVPDDVKQQVRAGLLAAGAAHVPTR
jgi:hypothetical protein